MCFPMCFPLSLFCLFWCEGLFLLGLFFFHVAALDSVSLSSDHWTDAGAALLASALFFYRFFFQSEKQKSGVIFFGSCEHRRFTLGLVDGAWQHAPAFQRIPHVKLNRVLGLEISL